MRGVLSMEAGSISLLLLACAALVRAEKLLSDPQ
jgi:hypothetical protein